MCISAVCAWQPTCMRTADVAATPTVCTWQPIWLPHRGGVHAHSNCPADASVDGGSPADSGLDPPSPIPALHGIVSQSKRRARNWSRSKWSSRIPHPVGIARPARRVASRCLSPSSGSAKSLSREARDRARDGPSAFTTWIASAWKSLSSFSRAITHAEKVPSDAPSRRPGLVQQRPRTRQDIAPSRSRVARLQGRTRVAAGGRNPRLAAKFRAFLHAPRLPCPRYNDPADRVRAGRGFVALERSKLPRGFPPCERFPGHRLPARWLPPELAPATVSEWNEGSTYIRANSCRSPLGRNVVDQ